MEKHKNYIISIIGSIRDKYKKYLENELAKHGIKGILSTHGSILAVLYKNNGKLKVTEIAKKCEKAKSTMTELVQKLEKNGYVEKIRCAQDRRSVYVHLTQKAYLIQNDFVDISKNLLEKVYQGMSLENQEKLLDLLFQVNENF